jgi:16S rRNA (cytidine1402-2'-O)-methyltransferase
VVLLEAPHRIEALAQALSILGSRLITVGRELTKQFETVHTVEAQKLPAWFAEKADHVRGEFALVIHALDKPKAENDDGLRCQQFANFEIATGRIAFENRRQNDQRHHGRLQESGL